MTDQQDSGDQGLSRRRFIVKVMAVLIGAIAALLAIPVAGFATAPGWQAKSLPKLISTSIPPTLRSDEWTAVGKVADFEVGVPKYLQVTRRIVDGWVSEDAPIGIHVVRTTDADVAVFDPHCTHLGCPLAWSTGARKFECPCHGGSFTSNGEVASGPPPRPMFRYETRIEAGQVFIGKLVEGG